MDAGAFLNERRLLAGPWQALERDVARLLLFHGFDDVRLVGGTGDRGGDILAVKASIAWVFQCKHTTSGLAPRSAVTEVVDAAKFYGAKRMVVALSRPPSEALSLERARYGRLGMTVDIADPRELLRLARAAPEYPLTRRKLRPYQDDAAERLRRALTDTGRGQIVLATGLGKTLVMAEVVADLLRDNLIKHGRVLVLAHTRELVEQLHRAFWHQLPKWVPTHQLVGGESPSFFEGATFATIQSVQGKREELPPFGLVLVDEAHHVGADTFRETIRSLDAPMVGGVTATPWRGDGFDIDQILGSPVVQIGIAEGLQRGHLSEVDYRLLGDNVDWQLVQELSKHRYSLSQLNRRLLLPKRDEEAAKVIHQVFHEERRRAGIVYSPTIMHAKAFAAILRQYGFTAETISSEVGPRDRYRLMARFRAGEIQFVSAVDLFNEGVDVPDVDCLVFMRATHSRRIFVQQLGRGLRPSPTKDKVIVLDFVTDLRRIAEVVNLDRSVRAAPVERLGLGNRLIQFSDSSAGTFLREWMIDQASLFLREDDPQLELPLDLTLFEYPTPPPPGGVQ